MRNLYFIILSSIRFYFNIFYKISNKNNVLIIQISGIGDAILSLPFIEYYKNLYPNYSINILTTENNKNIFYLNNNIKNIYFLKKNIIYTNTNKKKYTINDFFDTFSYGTIISFRLNLAILKNILFIPAIYYPNPLFEKLRLKSRIFSFFSMNYKKNF